MAVPGQGSLHLAQDQDCAFPKAAAKPQMPEKADEQNKHQKLLPNALPDSNHSHLEELDSKMPSKHITTLSILLLYQTFAPKHTSPSPSVAPNTPEKDPLISVFSA